MRSRGIVLIRFRSSTPAARVHQQNVLLGTLYLRHCCLSFSFYKTKYFQWRRCPMISVSLSAQRLWNWTTFKLLQLPSCSNYNTIITINCFTISTKTKVSSKYFTPYQWIEPEPFLTRIPLINLVPNFGPFYPKMYRFRTLQSPLLLLMFISVMHPAVQC